MSNDPKPGPPKDKARAPSVPKSFPPRPSSASRSVSSRPGLQPLGSLKGASEARASTDTRRPSTLPPPLPKHASKPAPAPKAEQAPGQPAAAADSAGPSTAPEQIISTPPSAEPHPTEERKPAKPAATAASEGPPQVNAALEQTLFEKTLLEQTNPASAAQPPPSEQSPAAGPSASKLGELIFDSFPSAAMAPASAAMADPEVATEGTTASETPPDDPNAAEADDAPPSSEPPDPLIGTVIGDRYRIESVLGTGGMGTVYLSEHVLMEKRMALKVLHPNLAVVSAVMDRFQKEAVALARIDHPNVVSATDFGKLKNGSFYLALQYIVGGSLADLLEGRGALEVQTSLSITRQICRALGAAHAEGIVHRDLKPHNVMLTGDDGLVVKVLDFGLAKLRSKTGTGPVTRAGSVFGTPHYMAPEQVTGQEVDERADLYSLGVLLYEMLAGHRPFDSERVQEVLGSQVSEEAEPLPETIPIDVRQLVDKLMRKSRGERPASAEEVLQILDSMLDPPTPPATVSSSNVSWVQRETNLFGLTLPNWSLLLPLVTFAVMIVAGLLSSRGPAAQEETSEQAQAEKAAPRGGDIAPPPERWPSLISAAEFGDEAALEELMQIEPARRDKELWLVLGQGLMKRKKTEDAMELYRQAIHRFPELENNKRILKNVRLATTDSRSAAKAITVAAESMGSGGADLVFAVWAETRARTRTTALAHRYLEQKVLLDKASPQLLLALNLREEELNCQQVKPFVISARELGDTRSLRPLRKLRTKTGCGTSGKDDCFACLRDENLVERAIEAASKRVAPQP